MKFGVGGCVLDKGVFMKSVLISIQPKWVEKIASGEKTIEVRKTRPKLETPFKCYIYATKPKKYYKVSRFIATSDENLYLVNGKIKMDNGFAYWGDGVDYEYLNRKVIGEFVCDKITDISVVVRNCNEDYNQVYHNDECKGSCLTWKELQEYGKGKPLYGWHISDLKIYEKPKELSEFYTTKYDIPCEHKKRGFNMDFCMAYENGSHFCKELICDKKRLTRPPQSWQFIEMGD